MNVYRISVESEKGDETWTTGAGSTPAAIGKILRRTKNTNVKRLEVYCELVEKNISYNEWKSKQAKPQG